MGHGGVHLCAMHLCTFNLEHVQVIWGHLVPLSKNWAVTRKQLIVQQNRQKSICGACRVCNYVLLLWKKCMLGKFGVMGCAGLKIIHEFSFGRVDFILSC